VKKTTQERDPEAAEHLRELIKEISVGMMTTVVPHGALRSRPMITREVNDKGEIWFLLSDSSEIAQDIADEHAVNLSYADPSRDRYVSVTGQASIGHELSKVRALWDAKLAKYFPKGLDDPHLASLCVRIETADYWDMAAGRMKPVHGVGNRPTGSNSDDDDDHTQVAIRAAPASG
jgi:general stress protein 26